MKLGHIFHALGWSRDDMNNLHPQKDPYLGKAGETQRVSASGIQRSVPKKVAEAGFGASVKIDADAVYRLANRKYDPNYMSKDDSKRMAALLKDAGAISRRDYAILTIGLDGEKKIDDTTPRDMVAAWQGKLHKDIAAQDFQSVDADSRALTILGRVVSAA